MLTLTPYQNRKDRKFDFDECSQLKTTIKKESEEGRINFQNKCVSSQNHRYRKEEGATVAASHLPSLRRNSAGWSRKGRTGRDSPRRFHFMGKPHKIPQMSYLRYETAAIFRHSN